MALLALKDIGKIYVSEGNVAVGIRGVSLSFEKGEFVAVTGKSGSGKSTLLNTISGMDTYEEGELYIEGQPTSHYLQPEWEEYRQKYISFIFQDYNIIDSFTVLQNVELALLHIENKKERRQRAMELIRRVGLESHTKHKGSKLSGGQKQRTVIARALAKDSPIILADEPTGNLDAKTSAEIIQLLHEVSEDKLVIVVTHNFDDFAEYATRHIRVFDGAVAFDQTLREVKVSETVAAEEAPVIDGTAKQTADKKAWRKREKRNGRLLGSAIFRSKPMLSLFLCALMIMGTAGAFLVTSMSADMGDMFQKPYMFNHIDGRVIIAKRNGEGFTRAELDSIKEKYGAESYLQFDSMIDAKHESGLFAEYSETGAIKYKNRKGEYELLGVQFDCYGDYGKLILGRYPENSREVFLNLPISEMLKFGFGNEKKEQYVLANGIPLKVVGVRYYLDNNKTPTALLSEEGFRAVEASSRRTSYASGNVYLTLTNSQTGDFKYFSADQVYSAPDLEAGQIYLNSEEYKKFAASGNTSGYSGSFTIGVMKDNNDYYYNNMNIIHVTQDITEAAISQEAPSMGGYDENEIINALFVSDELFIELVENAAAPSYSQASVFFENDKEAGKAADKLHKDGFVAVPSYTRYDADKLFEVIGGMFLMSFWLLAMLFLSLCVYLCSIRSIDSFKGDMAIMRSMGISVRTIKTGMYVRMLLALLPALVLLFIGAVLIYTNPILNGIFAYLYWWQYALIVGGMTAITVLVTRKQVKRLFRESVKKALKGGEGNA